MNEFLKKQFGNLPLQNNFLKNNTNEVNVANTDAKTPAAQIYLSAINNPITAISK